MNRATMPTVDSAFRPVTEADLDRATRWFHEPHVSPWWTPADADDVAGAVRGDVRLDPWLLLVGGAPVGYLQTYVLADHPAYAEACATVGVPATAYGFDYLIGDRSWIGRGLGTLAIGRFVEEIVFGLHGAAVACAGPHPDNGASLRVLEKNGFSVAGDIVTADGPERLMVLDRRLTR